MAAIDTMRTDSELQQLMAEWRRVAITLERRGWEQLLACGREATAVLGDVVTAGSPDERITIIRDIDQWLAVARAIFDARLWALGVPWWPGSLPVDESVRIAFDSQLSAGIHNAGRCYASELARLAKLEARLLGDIAPASECRFH